MTNLTKRSTVYFDPVTHRSLCLHAAAIGQSLSRLIDDALRGYLAGDVQDLEVILGRMHELEISQETLLSELKAK